MYWHRGTFNVLFQVTTAAAVLAAAAHTYQISLFVLLSAFQNHAINPKSCYENLYIVYAVCVLHTVATKLQRI